MPKQWRIHPHDPARIESLRRTADIPAVVAQLLICRGIVDPDLARDFLEPRLSKLRKPEELPGVPAASERILSAIRGKERIVVYGDYDVDGMTSAAILWHCLKLLGADVGYYVPHRVDEGYGLNDDALRRLADEGVSTVITVDCGITSVAESKTAHELGLSLIITDHHEPAAELPDAQVIVHPALPGTSYPFAGLCGAGVAFKLAWSLCQQASGGEKVTDGMRRFLLQAVAMAALGTVADVAPLVDENRILVRHGLNSLQHDPPLGLSELMRVAKIDKKSQYGSDDVAFSLAPRLNAVGRLGQARLGVELLTTSSRQRAAELAAYVDQLNAHRQTLERSTYRSALSQIKEHYDPRQEAALVLEHRDWHAGVIGIVAGQLAEKFHRPIVLIALDKLGARPAQGSARSIVGFALHEALEANSEFLVSHGGHAAAAGLKIEEEHVPAFRAAFAAFAAEHIPQDERQAELWIDAETPLSACTMQAVNHIEQLAPFGQGNQRPVLCTSGVSLVEPPRRIGGGGRHLSVRVVQHGVQLRGVAFGGGDWADEMAKSDGSLAIAFRPVINEFRGRRTVELHIADWRPESPDSS